MKNLLKNFLFLIVLAVFSINAENIPPSLKTETVFENNTIASEIAHLKKNDAYIKKYETIEDYGLKLFLNYIQKAKIMANSNEAEQIKLNFVYDIQPLFNEAVHINEAQAPKLHALINDLAQKANIINAPVIFLSLNKKLSNAWAMTYSKDLTCIIICENLIKNMTDDELKAIIAHEFGHIVNDSVKKVSPLDKYLTPKSLLITRILTAFSLLGTSAALISLPWTSDFIKNNLLLSSTAGAILATPLIGFGILVYLIVKKQHNPSDEVNADKIAIDITNDPASFIRAMEVLKNQYLKEFGTIEKGLEVVDENLEDLKGTSESWFNKLNSSVTSSKNNIEATKKNIIENGCVSHPGIDKRIEFGKQELEKLLQLAQA